MSEQRDREEYNAQRAAEDYEYDRQRAQQLEDLSARVVEAAVRWRLDSIHPSVRLVVDETPMLNATQEDVDLVAAVDALIAERQR